MCPACLNDKTRKKFPFLYSRQHNGGQASSSVSTGYTGSSGMRPWLLRLGKVIPWLIISPQKAPEGPRQAGLHRDRPKQRFIRGNFSAYVYRQLSVILAPVPRTLKLAGDGEIWHHWQCARSLPPLPTLLEFSFAGTRIFYRLCSRSPCLAGFTPASPRTGREKRESYVRFCEPHPAFHLWLPRLFFLSLGRARHSEPKAQVVGRNNTAASAASGNLRASI